MPVGVNGVSAGARRPGRAGRVLFACLAAVLAGCPGGGARDLPAVRETGRVAYRCETGETITARYFTLADGTLSFARVTMPDGREHTLPAVMSASGVRYTDERELVWWTKGETAFAEVRDADGQWQVKYRDCRIVGPGA